MYKQPIILFGLILPLLAAVVLIGAVFYAKSEVESSFSDKQQHFAGSEITRKAAMGLEKAMIEKRPHLARWKTAMAQEPSSEIPNQMRNIAATLPSKEIQFTLTDASPGAGIGIVTLQKSTQVRLAYRGTFRTMQRAFLELETRCPQLQLQQLQIDPDQNQSLLNFQITYTAWEN